MNNPNSSSMCILPFMHMATKTDGSIKLCCRSHPMGNINDNSLEEVWNNDGYKKIRKQLLAGEKPIECDACWRQEDIGVRSMRQRLLKTKMPAYASARSSALDTVRDDFSMPFRVPVMEIKFSNLCNLKCRMCHPLDSTSWSKDWGSIKHLMKGNNESTYVKVESLNLATKPFLNAWEDNEKFWKEFDALVPFFDRVEFAGGEPIIDPTHYRILEKLLPYSDKINLKYATNLTKLDFKGTPISELWSKFKRIDLTVSIDGVDDVYNYVRQLGNYSVLKNNILSVQQNKNVFVVGSCTVQVYNIFSLPEIFDEFVEVLNIDVQTHLVNYPKFLDLRVIPNPLRVEIIDRIEQYINSIPDKTHKNWTAHRKSAVIKFSTDMLNACKGGDLSNLLPEFVEFSDTLDRVQNSEKTWRELLPELNTEVIKLNE